MLLWTLDLKLTKSVLRASRGVYERSSLLRGLLGSCLGIVEHFRGDSSGELEIGERLGKY